MTWILFKSKLSLLLSSFYRGTNKDGKLGLKLLSVLLLLLFSVCFFLLSFALFSSLAVILLRRGEAPVQERAVYFSFCASIAFLISVISSVFIAQNQIYSAKDNELLLSMPVRPSSIVASRLIFVLVYTALSSFVIHLPAFVVYCLHCGFSAVLLICFLPSFAAGVFFSLAVTILLSWLFSVITRKMKHKNLFYTVFLFVFVGAYLFLYMNFDKYFLLFLGNVESIGEFMRKYISLFYLFGRGCTGNYLSLAAYLLICTACFAVMYIVLSRSFIKIATSKPVISRTEYKRRELKVSSVQLALYKKELKRYFSLPVYITNTAFAAVLQLVVPVLIISKQGSLISGFEASGAFSAADMELLPALIVCAGLVFCASMCSTASSSLSLEGSCINMLRALPLKAGDICNSKILVNLTVGIPTALTAAAVTCIFLPVSLQLGILLFVLPASVQLFTAVFGMCANLWLPRFDYQNETAAVKQSFSVLLGILCPLAAVILVALGCILLPFSLYASMWIYCFVFIILSFAFKMYLHKYQDKLLFGIEL